MSFVLALAAGGYLLFWAARIALWRVRAPELAPESGTREGVTLLLPMRDEKENIAACLAGLAAQTARPRIVVIDDSSTDGSAQLARTALRGYEDSEILTAPPLPDGWRGKVHALATGERTVATDWIVSTDADTRHQPALLARALETAQARQLDSLSVSGYQIARGSENLLTPPIFALLDGLLGDWHRQADGESSVANGQFILVKRSALGVIGGFAAIRNAVLDDVVLVERLRSAGFRHGFFRAPGLLRIRMYHGVRATLHGWRRIFGTFLGDSGPRLLHLLSILVLPPTLLAAASAQGEWRASGLLWLAGVFSSMTVRRSSGHAPAWAFLYPLDSLLLALCLFLGWRDGKRGTLTTWKGRELKIEPPSRPGPEIG